jgi:hypothetical protein
MINYNTENNINFYEELYSSLDYDSDNEVNVCQITGNELTEKHVVLECKHAFNYEPLYKEICRQKFVFKTYDLNSLSKADKQKCKDRHADYFIKCPYCRSVQFTILPHYEELGLKQIYGINTLDKTFSNTTTVSHSINNLVPFSMFGVNFSLGQCSHIYSYDSHFCTQSMVAKIPINNTNTNISFCKFHYKSGLKAVDLAEKKKLAEEKKMAAEKNLAERTKLFNEKNKLREAKGLAPLKHLPKLKAEQPLVQAEQPLVQAEQPLVQAEQQNVVLDISPNNNDNTEQLTIGCQAILKSGANKGNKCGNKLPCKRHVSNKY